MGKLPWGMKKPPTVSKVNEVTADIDDHLGRSSVMLVEWSNGEGFSLEIHEESNVSRIDVSWCQCEAILMCIKALKKQLKIGSRNGSIDEE